MPIQKSWHVIVLGFLGPRCLTSLWVDIFQTEPHASMWFLCFRFLVCASSASVGVLESEAFFGNIPSLWWSNRFGFCFFHRCLSSVETTQHVDWIPDHLSVWRQVFYVILFFLFYIWVCLFFCYISCEAFVEKSTFEDMLNPKIFICHSAVLRNSSWCRWCKYSCVLLLLHITYIINWAKYV